MPQRTEYKKIGHAKSPQQKSTWYSPVSQVYYTARPPYPQQQIDRAIEMASLSSDSSVLEIGCGPGNATVALAKLDCAITCVEPNLEFCDLAKTHCEDYPKVKVHQAFFEQWKAESALLYDAVLSANAFHWISPEVKYAEASKRLNDHGHLILLWNLTPEPEYEVYQQLKDVYSVHAPSLVRYEGEAVQAEILEKFAQEITESRYFEKPETARMASTIEYTVDDYLNLLSTLRRIEPDSKEALFRGIREQLSETITLSFLSEVQVARRTQAA